MAYKTYDTYTTSDGTKYVGMYSDNRTQIYKEDADGNRTILSSTKGGRRTSSQRKKVSEDFDSFIGAVKKAETGVELTYTDEDVTAGGGGLFKKDKASTLTFSDGTVLSSKAGRTSNEVATLKRLADEIGAVSIANKPDETEDTTDTNTTDDTTVLDETTDTALDTVEEISDQTFGGSDSSNESGVDNTDNISNYFDNTVTSLVNTAAGQKQNQESALTTSVGEAEDEAISYMTGGTASNVLNPGGAQGLLSSDDDEDDPFNRRKTLIGA